MTDSPKHKFKPAGDKIKSHSQVCSCIQIPEFDKMITGGEISTIQVFYERIAQEIYNTRKQNYSWGFRVIEPEFLNFSDRIILVSKLYKEEHLSDLNSVIFKLFTEFNNIIISTALQMHLPVKGIIRIGNIYRGSVRSKKPAVVTGKDPLILSDLLKVFSIGEIFPNGFSEGLIPAVEIPFHFGESISAAFKELSSVESIGIFMPADHVMDNIAHVTILANMLVETEIDGRVYYVCNWKEWMREHSGSSPENVLTFAAEEAGNSSPHATEWQSLMDYSAHL